ncbi:hypothetical protein EYF80_052219 [Liparis tanakae]|uniref:Secreted protein n=1 Tax=Liparis tanakae TaxID=230148 RepID=A0A4Z2F8X9_9TELE|nr:hypothetical protein EYF80_052219 [Liparis tanakae]
MRSLSLSVFLLSLCEFCTPINQSRLDREAKQKEAAADWPRGQREAEADGCFRSSTMFKLRLPSRRVTHEQLDSLRPRGDNGRRASWTSGRSWMTNWLAVSMGKDGVTKQTCSAPQNDISMFTVLRTRGKPGYCNRQSFRRDRLHPGGSTPTSLHESPPP